MPSASLDTWWVQQDAVRAAQITEVSVSYHVTPVAALAVVAFSGM